MAAAIAGCTGPSAVPPVSTPSPPVPSADANGPSAAPSDASTTPWPASTPAHEILARVEERGRCVQRFDAHVDLDLRRADGAEATLSGTLRMERPDRFRLRSTKFGFLVCDVVLRGGDAWAILSPVVRDQARASAEATNDLLRVLGSLLGWRGSDAAEFLVVNDDPDRLVVEAIEPSGTRLLWTLSREDGRVLEVRRLEGVATVGLLRCSDHECIDSIPVPRTLRFESITGTIGVRLHRSRINAPHAPESFTAPEGAERLE